MKRVKKGRKSQLIVFEGPDGCGKTTLAISLVKALNRRGYPAEYFSFPGQEEGTLGKAVYEIHHNQPFKQPLNPTSLQLLHVAAHIDCIQRRITPLLKQRCIVILDRYWWTTWAYGRASGVPEKLLQKMIDLEETYWDGVRPNFVLLPTRSGTDENSSAKGIKIEYEQLASRECELHPVVAVDNNGSVEDSVEAILCQLLGLHDESGMRARPCAIQGHLDIRRKSALPANVFSKLSPAKQTPVYDAYWELAAKRQEIFFTRYDGNPPPWSDDPILQTYKFTNAYRASDRVSQYLISKVIYSDEFTKEDLLLRILLFKFFNRIGTWQLLEANFGRIVVDSFSAPKFSRALTRAASSGSRVYTAAYIMPSGMGGGRHYPRKHLMHLHLLNKMIEDGLPNKLGEARSMKEAFEALLGYPTIGPFLAYQYVTDLNYSPLLNFEEMEFVVPGPGAKEGIRKCFSDPGGLTEADIIRVVADRQEVEFERLGISFKSLWGRRLQLIDCQNLFCEVDKYARVRFPEYDGRLGRTRIKQRYRMNSEPLEYWYPSKWGINDKIRRGIRDV